MVDFVDFRLGPRKDFLFSLHPVNERDRTKAWGLLRWDYSAKPAYVALANLTWQLEGARYVGALNPAEGVRGFLYQMPDGSQTLVFWSESELDKAQVRRPDIDMKNDFAKDISLLAPSTGFLGMFPPGKELKLTDLMGRERLVVAEGGPPIYLASAGWSQARRPRLPPSGPPSIQLSICPSC